MAPEFTGDTAAAPLRSVTRRDVDQTAPARCGCYALASALVASPHDLDPRPALRERLAAAGAVDYAEPLGGLIEMVVETDLTGLKREYSGLFEVGDDGPPAPIREDLQTGQRSGTREDIVRFYGFFNYRLGERYAWAPDHLSVELEFMHFLCHGEAAGADRQSYQLAQLDFSARHLVNWLPQFALKVAKLAPDALYARVLAGVSEFVTRDHDWQSSTIVESAAGEGH